MTLILNFSDWCDITSKPVGGGPVAYAMTLIWTSLSGCSLH